MKTMLSVLFLCLSAVAQIGALYGTGTADYFNSCNTLIWHANNNYAANGTATIGGQFYWTCNHRDLCATDQLFLHVLSLGGSQANTFIPASVTGTNDSWILTSNDVTIVAQQSPWAAVDYAYLQVVPNNPALVGMHFYGQWMIYWVNAANETKFMLSRGLDVWIS